MTKLDELAATVRRVRAEKCPTVKAGEPNLVDFAIADAVLAELANATESMVRHGFDIHPCQPGESKVSDAFKAMIQAVREERDR